MDICCEANLSVLGERKIKNILWWSQSRQPFSNSISTILSAASAKSFALRNRRPLPHIKRNTDPTIVQQL